MKKVVCSLSSSYQSYLLVYQSAEIKVLTAHAFAGASVQYQRNKSKLQPVTAQAEAAYLHKIYLQYL